MLDRELACRGELPQVRLTRVLGNERALGAAHARQLAQRAI